jgi:hypothetical protein
MRRSSAFFLFVLNLLLLGGLVIFNLSVEVQQAELSSYRPQGKAIVGAVVGSVEVRSNGSSSWQKARVGALLSEKDEVRTGLYSEATVHLRGISSVVISPNSSFVVGQEYVKRSLFELGEGRIVAAIPEFTGRRYQFHSKGSAAVAWSQQGQFSLATDGKGTVVVDASRGKVELSAKGRNVQIRKGKRSVVFPGKAPSDVLPVPTSVALQVRWPPKKIDRRRAKISGKTTVAATVLINGKLVRADDEGLFALDLALREGKNRLVITSTDVSGNSSARQLQEVQVDTKPPDVKVDAKDLWK